ncbi:Crp/Fnr family transcriptional regulator [Zunongwangia pacifica]|uniref:Crp/Fnr family transcriptional regulator n=1 Tax=Zunongwangia pacifica TaxID=2911062 RepID=A0A9X1ZSQ3_9FLAO|nr:Crp/Fnr family transcriptional regulator [Zunongwangia pacifica]MCL6220332.1 Crp/Fnr family transcriptional regulator [Zunongwangia pacifica]
MFRINQEFLKFIEDHFQHANDSVGIELVSFESNEILMEQDQIVRNVYLIKSGICKVYFEEENGKEYILEFLSTGEILGELEIIRDETCLCSVKSIIKVEAFKIPKNYFLKLLNGNLSLNKMIIHSFAERIINTSKKASHQKLYSIEYSLTKIMEMQKKNDFEISKSDLSAYLGISIRSLNRSLKSLKENPS